MRDAMNDLLALVRLDCRQISLCISLLSFVTGIVLAVGMLKVLPRALEKAKNRAVNSSKNMFRAGKGSAGKDLSKQTVGIEQKPTDKSDEHPLSQSVYWQDTKRQPEQQLHLWHYVGASVRGVGHVASNTDCQDYHICRHLPTGELLIAVADGVGSAAHSAKGAEVACHTAIQFLERQLVPPSKNYSIDDFDKLLRRTFSKSQSAVTDAANGAAIQAREYATTLVIVVLTQELVAAGMIGDGMVVAEDLNGDYSCLFTLSKHEYANQMIPLTSSKALETLQVKIVNSPLQFVSVLTDGLLRMSCDLRKMKPYPPFFEGMKLLLEQTPVDEQTMKQLEKLLDSPLINERTEDDKTLVMAKAIRVDDVDTGNSNCNHSFGAFGTCSEVRTDEDLRSEQQDVSGGAEVA